MRFKKKLPKGCVLKVGGLPVVLIGSVEVESETPIRVEIINGNILIALPDEKSIDDINNNPNNRYYRKQK